MFSAFLYSCGDAINCMKGTVIWRELEPYFDLVEKIRVMMEKVIMGQYGGLIQNDGSRRAP